MSTVATRVDLDDYRYIIWDIAGNVNYRKVWHSYTADADLVVYLVDGADQTKIEEFKASLKELLDDK